MKIRKPFVNNRTTASHTPSPEYIEVELRDGQYIALLAESPADPGDPATPMVVVLDGTTYNRVSGMPAANQFKVSTASVIQNGTTYTEFLPILLFHSSASGLIGTCDYYRTGSIFTAEWQANEREFSRAITGYTAPVDLLADYPPQMDFDRRGYPGDMAMLTNGQPLMSDGSNWNVLGAPGGQYEYPTATGGVTASVTDIQSGLEGLQAAMAGIADLTDKYHQIEILQALIAGEGTVTDGLISSGEDLTVTAEATASVDELYTKFTEEVLAEGGIAASIEDVQAWITSLQATGTVTPSLADLQAFIEAIQAVAESIVTLTEDYQQPGGGTITPFSDDFNRSNGALGSDWASISNCLIVSNKARFSASGSAQWIGSTDYVDGLYLKANISFYSDVEFDPDTGATGNADCRLVLHNGTYQVSFGIGIYGNSHQFYDEETEQYTYWIQDASTLWFVGLDTNGSSYFGGSVSVSSGDLVELRFIDSTHIAVFINGTQQLASFTLTNAMTGTITARVYFATTGTALAEFDNFDLGQA